MKRVKVVIERGNITQEDVMKHFQYNPTNGRFLRILKYDGWHNPIKDKSIITDKNNRGYYWVKFFGKMHLVHRLIWLLVTGYHPNDEIDHIDGNRLNNQWENLRDVTAFENSRNQGNRVDNTSGTRGVSYMSSSRGLKKWLARISHKGVRYYLGNYLTKNEAVKVRKQAEIDFKYHPNHAKRSSWRK